MKRNIIFLIILGFLLTTGCEKFPVGNAFLEKAPGVDVTIDTVFKNIENAESFLWNAYYGLYFGLYSDNSSTNDKIYASLLENLSDMANSYSAWTGCRQVYYSGLYTASNEVMTNIYGTKYNLGLEKPYVGIRKGYIFVENIGRVPDVDPAYRAQLKAEARMIIAMHYFEIFHHFGGVSWLDKAISPTDDISELPRLTAQATCDSIVSLCDKAMADLPWTLDDVRSMDGRFTKAAAMGLKAKALNFNASPIFNDTEPYLAGEASDKKLVWHGSFDANRWKKAADAAHELIAQAEATGAYKLYHKDGNSYQMDFREAYFLRGNGEVLISTRKGFRYNTNWFVYGYRGANECPTQEAVDMFPMASGLPIDDPASGYDPANPNFNASGVKVRDPRLYESILVNNEPYQGRKAELWVGGLDRPTLSGNRARSGYILRKYQLDTDAATSINAIFHWAYLRLAEIYLIFAEADNEFNNGPTPEAYRCVNLVRSRVGLNNLPAGLDKVQFREAVLRERACELYMEESRWFDLIRWKREADFKKQLHDQTLTRSASAPYTYTIVINPIPLRYWQINWSPKWYLSAWPRPEVQKGYGLIQNPGWE